MFCSLFSGWEINRENGFFINKFSFKLLALKFDNRNPIMVSVNQDSRKYVNIYLSMFIVLNGVVVE